MSAEPRFPIAADSGTADAKPRLTVVPAEAGTPSPARRPLSRSRSLKAQSNRWRVFIALGAMLVALLTVLVLSIVMASRQYKLVELRSQEQALSQENEALVQEIEYYQAPQDLAIRASQLGLVAGSSQATLNLNTGEITGIPMAAEKGQAESKNRIAPPALSDTQAYEKAQAQAEEERKKEERKKQEEAKAKAKAKASARASSKASPQPSAPSSAPANR
ncbi:hypothetical protein ACN08Y_09105 [Rothia sp. P5764]|uniref:hypothetical protein n=1 Tax=Rothia sp. P5764 TaxID=3402654 RepID=UPI003AD379B7